MKNPVDEKIFHRYLDIDDKDIVIAKDYGYIIKLKEECNDVIISIELNTKNTFFRETKK